MYCEVELDEAKEQQDKRNCYLLGAIWAISCRVSQKVRLTLLYSMCTVSTGLEEYEFRAAHGSEAMSHCNSSFNQCFGQ